MITADGTRVGTGNGGSANHAGQGYASAVSHVLDAVREALAGGSASLEDVATAHFALAGDDVQDDHQQLTGLLADALGSLSFRLSNDVWAGLRAGSISGAGIAVNCGSGTGAVGKAEDGRMVMIPDLGYVFGDSGGGTQIGRAAFRAVVRAWDGRGDATALTPLILSATATESTDALYLALYRNQLGERAFRQATRLVFQAAASNDPVAIEILRWFGDEMGTSAVAIARRLELTDTAFPFVLTGGAIRTLHSPLVAAATARLRAVATQCLPTLPQLMPVAGAALLALDAHGVVVTAEHFAHLRAQSLAWHPEELFA